MAPYSIIGSCQPAYISPQGIQAINESKTINAIIALLEERARMHGRNVSVVREFVIENLNLNAEQALEANVIEFISSNIENLLEMTDGLTVNNKTLLTKGARINYFSPSFRVSLLDVIANPLIASLLLIIGLYALLFGLSSPGFGSEIFGAIAICLALIGLGFNLSLAALFLVFFGIGLVLFEITSPGFGAIGIAGIVCLTIGSILLVPLSYPKWFVSPEFQRTFILSLMVPAIIFACFLTFALLKVVQIRHKRPVIGELIGEEAEVIELVTPKKAGYVNYRGERWKAKSTKRIKPGEEVIIMNKVGSVLMVKPKKETS
jgi:membrane-bound serine protease (ClpP class)